MKNKILTTKPLVNLNKCILSESQFSIKKIAKIIDFVHVYLG